MSRLAVTNDKACSIPSTDTGGDTWQVRYWNDLSSGDGFQPVLDPEDEQGGKNERIDRVHRNRLEGFFRKIGLQHVDAVLDFGCGIGRHAGLLGERANKYVGVDVSAGMLLRARGDVRLIKGLPLPFDDHTFELVFVFWVLQHIVCDEKLKETIREFRRCLRPGGTVVICERSSAQASEAGMPESYIKLRSPDRYLALFREAGFRLDRIEKMEYRFNWRTLLRCRMEEGENLYAFTML